MAANVGSMFQYWKRFDLQQLQVRIRRPPRGGSARAAPPPHSDPPRPPPRAGRRLSSGGAAPFPPPEVPPPPTPPQQRPPQSPPPPAASPLTGPARPAGRSRTPSGLCLPPIDPHRRDQKLILFVQFIDPNKMAAPPLVPGWSRFWTEAAPAEPRPPPPPPPRRRGGGGTEEPVRGGGGAPTGT